jgi:hypothetical protein
VEDVPAGLVWFFKLQALMGAAFWIGLFWRRATVAGAWAATLVQLAILFGTSTGGFHEWATQNLPEYMVLDGKFRDSWQIFCYLIVGFGTGVLVSLVSSRVPKAQLDRVFDAIRTPVKEAEPHTPEPFTLPENLPVAHPRKVIDHPDFEIYWPSRLAVGGFVIFWACVAILIGFVYWMAGWGV